MPTFNFTSPDGKSYSVDGPDGATPEQAFGILQQHIGAAQPTAPQGFVGNAMDFAKSIPGGVVNGLSSALSAGGQASQTEMGQPVDVPGPKETSQILQQNVTGNLPQPQGMAGRFGESVGEAVGNPASYLGPGSIPLKVGGAVLGGLGGQAGEEVGGAPGRVLGSMAGGALAARAIGPSQPSAAIPTQDNLFSAADRGYKAAINSGVELSPKGVGQFAAAAKQELTNGPKFAFTGGPQGTAPKTIAALDSLANIPPDAKITAANLDTLRRHLGDIASEVQPTATPGVSKSTSDAVAAIALKDRLSKYLENVPQDHVVAGDPKAYTSALREANGNYAAASRLANVDARLTQGENQTARSISGSLDAKIRSKVGSMLDNPQKLRGLSDDEIKQIQLINDGTMGSNVLSQLGRGGAGVVPMIAQAGIGIPSAIATGGASVLPQAAFMAALYGARKAGEQITMSRAQKLAEMLAMRSPLYQQRVNQLPVVSSAPNGAQLLRSSILGLR